jgi:hypothetical protein
MEFWNGGRWDDFGKTIFRLPKRVGAAYLDTARTLQRAVWKGIPPYGILKSHVLREWAIARTRAEAETKTDTRKGPAAQADATGKNGKMEADKADKTDTKPDTQKNSLSVSPNSPDINKLCGLLRKAAPLRHGQATEIALDFAEGDERKAANLLRQARRFRHLWEPLN